MKGLNVSQFHMKIEPLIDKANKQRILYQQQLLRGLCLRRPEYRSELENMEHYLGECKSIIV